MATDYPAMIGKLEEMLTITNQIKNLRDFYAAGKMSRNDITVTFSNAQKQEILTQYNSLKTRLLNLQKDLNTLYKTLP